MNKEIAAIGLAIAIVLLTVATALTSSMAVTTACASNDPTPACQYVVGELPQRVLSQNYKMEHCWIPGTLAVYVDGKRLLEGRDYTAFPEAGDIFFEDRVRDCDIQVDYHIR